MNLETLWALSVNLQPVQIHRRLHLHHQRIRSEASTFEHSHQTSFSSPPHPLPTCVHRLAVSSFSSQDFMPNIPFSDVCDPACVAVRWLSIVASFRNGSFRCNSALSVRCCGWQRRWSCDEGGSWVKLGAVGQCQQLGDGQGVGRETRDFLSTWMKTVGWYYVRWHWHNPSVCSIEVFNGIFISEDISSVVYPRTHHLKYD